MAADIPKLSFEIIPATWWDLGALRRLERECFPLDAWPLLDLVAVLSFPNVIRLKAVAKDQVVGFVAGDQRPSENMAWIATIGVLPAFQRQGVATALLDACEAQLGVASIRLSVRDGNSPAIHLYERFGYQRVGRWPAYYQDGSDAIIFEKTCRSAL
jgi:ribosomal protein S18 acetylase RimI-like enzyme